MRLIDDTALTLEKLWLWRLAAIITTGPEDAGIRMEAMQFGVLCVLTRVVTREFLPTIAKVIERRGSPLWN
jgi:hypothetical protein